MLRRVSRRLAFAPLLVVAALGVTGGRAGAAQRHGWGAPASFLGRYDVRPLAFHVSQSQAPRVTAAQTGIFAPVVAATEAGPAVVRPTGGELTLFMRVAKVGKPPIPSGILELRAAGENRVLYLTKLLSSGTDRRATVSGGAFVGPVIGSFRGALLATGELSGLVNVEGLGLLTARLTRFSALDEP
jgi:hypothetical protein